MTKNNAKTVAKLGPNSKVPEVNFDKLYQIDGYLRTYEGEIKRRHSVLANLVESINEKEGGVERFASGYEKYGVQVRNNSIYWLEWIPGAEAVYLTGKLNLIWWRFSLLFW